MGRRVTFPSHQSGRYLTAAEKANEDLEFRVESS